MWLKTLGLLGLLISWACMHSTVPEVAMPLEAQETQGPLKMICAIWLARIQDFALMGSCDDGMLV